MYIANVNSNFNYLVVEIQSTEQDLPFGTNLQNYLQIDLIGLTQAVVTIEYSVFREAAFNNEVYFYTVDNAQDEVDRLAPSSNTYQAETLNNIVKDAVTGEEVKFTTAN
ncbi:MAG: hypothetical protein AAF915_01145 [Cyanobacteria bacterium P01_D01_bin.50]